MRNWSGGGGGMGGGRKTEKGQRGIRDRQEAGCGELFIS